MARDRSALEVVVTWGTTVLETRHLSAGVCTVGPDAATDHFLDARHVPLARYVLARADGARPMVNVPRHADGEVLLGGEHSTLADLRAAGRLEASAEMPDSDVLGLPPGAMCRLQFGDRAFLLRPVTLEAAPRASFWQRLDGRFGRHVAVAMLLHGLLGVTAASLPAEAASFRLDGYARVDRWADFITTVELPKPDHHPAERVEKRDEPGTPELPVAESEPVAPRSGPSRPRAVERTRSIEEGRSIARGAAESAMRSLDAEMSGLWREGAAIPGSSGLDGIGTAGGHGFDGPGLAGFPSGGGPEASLSAGDGPGGRRPGPRGPGDDPTRYAERTSTAPRPVPRDPIVVGALEMDEVRRAVRAHQAEYRYCYERVLQSRPGLSGKVVVRFTIGARGNVVAARLLEDTVPAPEVGACLKERLARWQFPEPRGGGTVDVSYPFLFRPL